MDSRAETVVNSPSDLPPPRQKKALRSVSPPLSNVSMHRFNYYIALFTAIVFAIYAYRLMQWKADAGSWWNLALGKKPPVAHKTRNVEAGWISQAAGSGGNGEKGLGNAEVEHRINELAAVLGLPSKDLHSAIAGAFREYMPPTSLSSIAAHQAGDTVKSIVSPSPRETAAVVSNGAYEAVTAAFGAAVGMDEPPIDVVS